MADIKISAAADAGTLVATDKVPLARSASTTAYSATMAEIATWANTNLPVASTTVSGTVKVDGTSITISGGTISSAAAPPASTSPPAMDGTANAGVLNQWSRGDHIHPSDTSRVTQAQGDLRWLQLGGGTTTGPVTLASGSTTTTVTPASDSTTKLATTAFVQSALGAAGAGVSSWNTRAGAVTLQQSDLSALNVYDDAGRNRIHNCGFSINQRGYVSGTALAAGAYGHDRWKAGAGGCTYTFTQNQPLTTVTITAGSLQQVVEAMSVAAGTYTLSWTGAAQGRVNAGTYAASPVTVTGLSANTTITVEFNTGTLGAVQLEVGSVATPLDYGGSPADQLRQCQRFYQVIPTFQMCGYASSGSFFYTDLVFPVPMRAAPSATLTAAGAANATAMTFNGANSSLAHFYCTITTTGVGYIASNVVLSADL